MPELWVYSLQLLGLFAVAFGGQLVARIAHGAIVKRRADAARAASASGDGQNSIADSEDHWALTIKELAEVMGAADELAQSELAPGLLDANGAQAVSAGLVRRARQLVGFEADFKNKHRQEISQLHQAVDKCEQLLKEMVDGVSVYVGELSPEMAAVGGDGFAGADSAEPGRTELERLVHASKKQLKRLSREIEELRRNAMVDALTGVPNRRAFDSEIERLVKDCQQGRSRLCAAMVDVDHFKKFNDAHGHAGGDIVLRTVAAALVSVCRDKAVVARYGGEEFALLMPGATFAEARAVAQQALDAITAAEARFEGKDFRVTASLGLAEWGAANQEIRWSIARTLRSTPPKKPAERGALGTTGGVASRWTEPARSSSRMQTVRPSGAARNGADSTCSNGWRLCGGPPPSGEELIPVEFCDISLTGCSFVLRAPLESRRVVVALGASPNLKYLEGDIVHCRRENTAEGVVFRVGCRFTGRLH